MINSLPSPIAAALALLLSLGLLSACDEGSDDTASEVSEEMGEAVEETGEAVQEAAEDTKEAMEEAAEEVEKKAE